MSFCTDGTSRSLTARVEQFMREHVLPNEDRWEREAISPVDRPWPVPAVLTELQAKARAAGLWNLFRRPAEGRDGLRVAQYAPLAEAMGWVPWAAEVFNCSAPDTGNMEVLDAYGASWQKLRWLDPLLEGTIRSSFLMTEPDVASSDATNIRTSIRRDGGEYVINGRKWFATGVMDPRCAIWIVMGVTDPGAPPYQRQSQVLVEPATAGVTVVRPLTVLGDLEPPHGHGEVVFEDVRVPVENIIAGEGLGFEVAQVRLGPGRIHHAMRTIGLAERALQMLCRRLSARIAFGEPLSRNGAWEQRVAEARIGLDMARLLTLHAAHRIDTAGPAAARTDVAAVKVAVPRMARRVIDMAIQGFGAAGLSGDYRLPALYATARWVSIADGPDEVHNRTIARAEFARHAPR
jgi:acyl-CoA dehydrogenase